jgi:CRISPR-associated protein Cmr5
VPDRIDQQLAAGAANALPDQIDKTMHTRMRQLPTMVHTNGLAATCAFLLSKDEPYQQTAEKLLNDVLQFAGIPLGRTPNHSLTTLANADPGKYQVAEARARSFAMWLSRIASARYTKPGTSGGGPA